MHTVLHHHCCMYRFLSYCFKKWTCCWRRHLQRTSRNMSSLWSYEQWRGEEPLLTFNYRWDIGCGHVTMGVVMSLWVLSCHYGCGHVTMSVVMSLWVWSCHCGCGQVAMGVAILFPRSCVCQCCQHLLGWWTTLLWNIPLCLVSLPHVNLSPLHLG